MPDDPAQQVREAVDEALADEVGAAVEEAEVEGFQQAEAGVALEDAREVIEEEDLTTFDFVEFRAAFTSRGFSAAEAEAAWAQLRAEDAIPEGGRDEHPKATGAADLDLESDDILVLKEGERSSQLIAQVLAEPLVDIDIESFMLESQEGKAIVDALDEAPSVPFYAVPTAEGFEVRPLEDLVEKFT